VKCIDDRHRVRGKNQFNMQAKSKRRDLDADEYVTKDVSLTRKVRREYEIMYA